MVGGGEEENSVDSEKDLLPEAGVSEEVVEQTGRIIWALGRVVWDERLREP